MILGVILFLFSFVLLVLLGSAISIPYVPSLVGLVVLVAICSFFYGLILLIRKKNQENMAKTDNSKSNDVKYQKIENKNEKEGNSLLEFIREYFCAGAFIIFIIIGIYGTISDLIFNPNEVHHYMVGPTQTNAESFGLTIFLIILMIICGAAVLIYDKLKK